MLELICKLQNESFRAIFNGVLDKQMHSQHIGSPRAYYVGEASY